VEQTILKPVHINNYIEYKSPIEPHFYIAPLITETNDLK